MSGKGSASAEGPRVIKVASNADLVSAAFCNNEDAATSGNNFYSNSGVDKLVPIGGSNNNSGSSSAGSYPKVSSSRAPSPKTVRAS